MANEPTIEYGAEVLGSHWTAAHLRAQEKVRQAVRLYQQGLASTGAAAEFADVPKTLFLNKLADYGVVTFELSREELRTEMASASRHM